MKLKIDKTATSQFILIFILYWPFLFWYRFLYILIIFYGLLNITSLFKVKGNLVRIIPILLFICWLYGEVLGQANGNGFYAIENFFGMSLLIVANSTNVFRDDFNSRLIRNITYAGAIQLLYFGLYIFIEDISIESYFLRSFTDISSLRLESNDSVILSIISFFLLLRRDWVAPAVTSMPLRIFFMALSLAAVLLSGSKGYFAVFALVFLVFCYISIRFQNNPGRNMILVSLLCFITLMLPTGLIQESYAPTEVSNARREEQAPYILAEVTMAGAGLGASLKSGYERGVQYGAELTYHSILHKFGIIVGSIILMSYIILWLNATYILLRKPNAKRFISFSLLCILIPAYGNPSLFSPSSIVAFIIAFAIICSETRRPLTFF